MVHEMCQSEITVNLETHAVMYSSYVAIIL